MAHIRISLRIGEDVRVRTGLYAIDRQARRIAAIHDAAGEKGVDLFINARTDLFLNQEGDPAKSIVDALDRA